jgi:hypothetical protein
MEEEDDLGGIGVAFGQREHWDQLVRPGCSQ